MQPNHCTISDMDDKEFQELLDSVELDNRSPEQIRKAFLASYENRFPTLAQKVLSQRAK